MCSKQENNVGSCCGKSNLNSLDVKEEVRKVYAKVAVTNSEGKDCGNVRSCCGAPKDTDFEYNKLLGYSEQDLKETVDGANMGLGCGNPTAIAALKQGETVLDLGSGGGFDCFVASRSVGPTGHVIGVDSTPEMITKARKNAVKGKYTTVEFRLGEIEHLPVADATVDVIISNCVVNLSTDKEQVLRDCFRVLKKGGRIAISDIVATHKLPKEIKEDLTLYSACISGAMSIDNLRESLESAGFVNVQINIKESTRMYIKEWSDSGAEDYVVSANIEAAKL